MSQIGDEFTVRLLPYSTFEVLCPRCKVSLSCSPGILITVLTNHVCEVTRD